MKYFYCLVILILLGAGCTKESEPTQEQETQAQKVSIEEESTLSQTQEDEEAPSVVSFTPPVESPDGKEPEQTPKSGPYVHSVWVASSDDGMTFTNDFDSALVEHASVPTSMEFSDGTIRSYFVDASSGPERFSCVESKDGGQSYEWGACRITGVTSVKAVDFSIVKLPDGRYRLYYYASGKVTDTLTSHNVDSAISTDGVNFKWEGTVFTYDGLVDPDVFWNGSLWVMHVYSIAGDTTVVATSEDGTSFSYYGSLSPSGYGVTKPIELSDGTFRMYGFKQPSSSSFVSFISEDGLNWTIESGTRLSVGSNQNMTDPFVIQLSNGTYKMFYKLDTR